jgi:hypothetical protein
MLTTNGAAEGLIAVVDGIDEAGLSPICQYDVLGGREASATSEL